MFPGIGLCHPAVEGESSQHLSLPYGRKCFAFACETENLWGNLGANQCARWVCHSYLHNVPLAEEALGCNISEEECPSWFLKGSWRVVLPVQKPSSGADGPQHPLPVVGWWSLPESVCAIGRPQQQLTHINQQVGCVGQGWQKLYTCNIWRATVPHPWFRWASSPQVHGRC